MMKFSKWIGKFDIFKTKKYAEIKKKIQQNIDFKNDFFVSF